MAHFSREFGDELTDGAREKIFAETVKVLRETQVRNIIFVAKVVGKSLGIHERLVIDCINGFTAIQRINYNNGDLSLPEHSNGEM